MVGLGTIINVALIISGGITGLIFGKKIKLRMRETLTSATGIAVIILGIGGALEKMLVIKNGTLDSTGTIMMISSLAIGGIIGELLNIESAINRFGEWLKSKSGSADDNSFVTGFVMSSCTVCIGAMAVIGSIKDGVSGDYTILLTKGILDAIIICIMTASLGKGCIFSAIPVAIFQGAITAAAFFAGGFMTEAALNNLSYVGSVLIFCVGLNLVRSKQVRVANLLPSIIIAVVLGFFNI